MNAMKADLDFSKAVELPRIQNALEKLGFDTGKIQAYIPIENEEINRRAITIHGEFSTAAQNLLQEELAGQAAVTISTGDFKDSDYAPLEWPEIPAPSTETLEI